MKKLLSTLFVVLFATSMMAQTGLTCEDPIPVDKSFTAHVDVDPSEGYRELWYSAWTYDLPMHVYFSPDNKNELNYGPDVQIDFSCTGDYSFDHKLDSVIKILEVMGLTLPVEIPCTRVVRDGKWEWDLSVDQKYRDQLTELGLTHNIQAFVRVSYYESGSIRLTPDTSFQSCIEHGHYAVLSDTIEIAANDSSKMIVLPFSEWKEEDIRFVWTGDQPACVWVAEDECRFTPVDASVYVKAKYNLDNTTHKVLTKADMNNAIDKWIGAGIYYAKVLSNGPGKLVVERIPLGEIQGDAILLKHGEPVQLLANDSRVFCFPKTWKSTEFLANTQYLMAMHVSNTPDFAIGDANVLVKYPFSMDANNRKLQLSIADISSAGATDDYLYVRFACNQATTLTPNLWNTTSCMDKTILISSGETISVPASSDALYRMAYKDWANYGYSIKWSGRSTLVQYVASYCGFEHTDPEILKAITVPARKSYTVEQSMVDSWSSSLGTDGFIFVRLRSSMNGDATITSAKPAETDPEGPVLDPVYTSFDATVCFGEAYEWNGQTYNETREYTQTFPAANGADSIVTLNLTVLPEVPVTKEIAAVCYGETYTWQDQEYAESGEYSVTLQDVNGCDSVITLTLTVHPQTPATTEEATIDFGTTYEWNGQTYSTAGEYTTTLQDENGCDYQATLILTILPEEQPETDGTILLNPTDELTINLDSAINVYHTEYDVWSAAKVQLNWYGDKPLHVFVAKDREFLVAIYHEDVVLYEKIEAVDPANGEPQVLVLNMSALRAYVNDGKLYVRFLTDADARLVIAPLTE
ncbi:MAG: hypothetical protein U0L47_05400 [Paludibacteraceae bacterium]|nr:hypothetical protein [Paludibacteraceae bacterium]